MIASPLPRHLSTETIVLLFMVIPYEIILGAAVIAGIGYESLPRALASAVMGVLVLMCLLAFARNCFAALKNDERLHAIKQLEWQIRSNQDRDGVWSSQETLMHISGQELPALPIVTRGTVLYGALILEEAGETLMALGKALEEASHGRNSQFYVMASRFARNGQAMMDTSKDLRIDLSGCQEELRGQPMSLDAAVELLDGITDLHVVTAGLGLASGLPGQEAYADVVGSNLSKANPDSGYIDKTPDGKWIKGSLYKEPNLAQILRPLYEQANQP